MSNDIFADPKFKALAKKAFLDSIYKPLGLFPLGNGFVALLGKNDDDVTELSIHHSKTGEEYPRILETALGMDITGTRLNMAHLPQGIDIIARLQRVTCFQKEGSPYLGLK